LQTWTHRYEKCNHELMDWMAMERYIPYRIQHKTDEDWAAEVEQELFLANRKAAKFPSYEEARWYIRPE
ncbi:1557_t:CDS:1, partial [Ambispora gerdemannii]